MTDETAFVNALRECLGLAPLGGEPRQSDAERFGGVQYVGETYGGQVPKRGATTRSQRGALTGWGE